MNNPLQNPDERMDPDRQGDNSVRKVKLEAEEYYENYEEEEQAELEYREKMARMVKKAVDEEEKTSMAIEAYHDEHFYYNIFRPHITVWIKWYKTKYLNSERWYSEQEAAFDLDNLTTAFDKMQQRRKMKMLLESIRKYH